MRNDTGVALGRFAAVGVGAPLITPAANLAEFQAGVPFSGGAPVAGRFAILPGPLAGGAIGPAVVSGVVPVQLEVSAAADAAGYARAEADPADATKLDLTEFGSAQVLWRESGAGTKWALVRLSTTPAAGTGGESCGSALDVTLTTSPRHDYLIAGAKKWLRVTVSGIADVEFTGFSVEGFDDGCEIVLTNVSAGAETVTVWGEDANSAAANRVALAGGELAMRLAAGRSLRLRRDNTLGRWREVTLPEATALQGGLVTDRAQTFTGRKTFGDELVSPVVYFVEPGGSLGSQAGGGITPIALNDHGFAYLLAYSPALNLYADARVVTTSESIEGGNTRACLVLAKFEVGGGYHRPEIFIVSQDGSNPAIYSKGVTGSRGDGLTTVSGLVTALGTPGATNLTAAAAHTVTNFLAIPFFGG